MPAATVDLEQGSSPAATPAAETAAAETAAAETAAAETAAAETAAADEVPAGQDGDEQPGDERNPNREAAKYRRKLREAEAERDQLRARLEEVQKWQVHQLLSDTLVKPDALWLTAKLPDLLDDDGNVDVEKVKLAADAAVAAGLERKPDRSPSPGQGRLVEVGPSPREAFAEALQPRKRR